MFCTLYDVVHVRLGKLVDEKGAALDQTVKNNKGEILGTIEKLLKDTKTGKIEYAVLELHDTKYQLPLQWSQFKHKNGHLTLNVSGSDLYPITGPIHSKDLSPEDSHYMEEINAVRNQSHKTQVQVLQGFPLTRWEGLGRRALRPARRQVMKVATRVANGKGSIPRRCVSVSTFS